MRGFDAEGPTASVVPIAVGDWGDGSRNRSRACRGGRLGEPLERAWAIAPEYVGIENREVTYTYVQFGTGSLLCTRAYYGRIRVLPSDRSRNAIGHDWAALVTGCREIRHVNDSIFLE